MVSVKSCVIPNKYKSNGFNILDDISRLENKVLTKAVKLNGIVKEISIGPNCTDTSCLDLSSSSQSNIDYSDDIDSMGYDERSVGIGKSTEQNGVAQEKETPEIRLMRKKKNCFNKARKESISILAREKLAQMKDKEQRIADELKYKKEELRCASAQRDYERKQLLLQEEEQRTNEAEYWRHLSKELNSQRSLESNERVKKALEKQTESEERQKRELKERRVRLDMVHRYQVQYREVYQYLQETTRKCKNSKKLIGNLTNETAKLKTINNRFELLIEKCKKGDVSNKDLEECDNILQQSQDIHQIFQKECDEINFKHDEAEKEQEQKENEKAEQRVEDRISGSGASAQGDVDTQQAAPVGSGQQPATVGAGLRTSESNDMDDCVDKASYTMYLELQQFLNDYEESLQPLVKNDSLKKFRFSCQRAVNTPVNAISPVSREHMMDKLIRLSRLLKGQPVPLGNEQFSASVHPLGIRFCTNLLAKKFVSQGEHTVSSKPEAAFAIAGIIVSLWQEFPDFGMLLMAHFQKECPYLIPSFMPQIEGQSNEDYYKVLGYQYIDGKVESQDKFLKRMSGIMRLYAAILVVQQHPRNVPHPLGLQEGWRWLAAILNLEPRADISATLILDMLEVAGSELVRCYGIQFHKLLHHLCTDFFPRIEKITPDGCGGPVRRLKTFLENMLKERQIQPPEGLLPANIW